MSWLKLVQSPYLTTLIILVIQPSPLSTPWSPIANWTNNISSLSTKYVYISAETAWLHYFPHPVYCSTISMHTSNPILSVISPFVVYKLFLFSFLSMSSFYCLHLSFGYSKWTDYNLGKETKILSSFQSPYMV